jgi:hypothetical protein
VKVPQIQGGSQDSLGRNLQWAWGNPRPLFENQPPQSQLTLIVAAITLWNTVYLK